MFDERMGDAVGRPVGLVTANVEIAVLGEPFEKRFGKARIFVVQYADVEVPPGALINGDEGVDGDEDRMASPVDALVEAGRYGVSKRRVKELRRDRRSASDKPWFPGISWSSLFSRIASADAGSRLQSKTSRDTR